MTVAGLAGCGTTAGDRSVAQQRCAKAAAQMPEPLRLHTSYDESSPPSPFDRPVSVGDLALSRSARSQAHAPDADPARSARFARLAEQPSASWFASTQLARTELVGQVRQRVAAATDLGQTAVLVAYALPLRDCGSGHSAGGATSGKAYVAWLKAVLSGIRAGQQGTRSAVAVVLEPDALAAIDDLPRKRRRERLALLRWATYQLAEIPGVAVYLDAGHSGWVPPRTMAERLSSAGVSMARGFALNVANFNHTEDEVRYGQQIAPWLGGKHFIVDTSRNGNGPAADQWCNPPGRALGSQDLTPGEEFVDAKLWIKSPGQSDGACGPGQPAAGEFWPSQADELMRNAGW